jgi:Putative auto-transporter adhesin, head GIN domain
MKQLFLAALITMQLCTVKAQKFVIDDPNVQERKLEASFTKIEVRSWINVYITQSNEYKLAVGGNNADGVSKIVTTVENGTLKITTNGLSSFGKYKLNVYVSVKEIDNLMLSGACNVSIVDALSANKLNVQCSGASLLKGKIVTQNLDLKISGASDVKLSGNAINAEMQLSGASTLNAFELISDSINVSASGASDAKVNGNKLLQLNARGASTIIYDGAGKLENKSTSGASDIKKRKAEGGVLI